MGKISIVKIISISFIVSFLCSLILVANFVHPIFLPLAECLKKYEGFWMALQGIGIPASLFIAVYLPTLQEGKNNLNRLIAHRNIAFFIERYVREEIAPAFKIEHRSEYIACVRELDKLDRSQIFPAQYIENFVDFINCSKQVEELISSDNIEVSDLVKIRSLDRRMTENIRKIDIYLNANKVKFDEKRVAYV